jgi:hypothetical protein
MKKMLGAVCAICGAAVLNAAQPHHECRSVVVLAERVMCPPPLFHQPDNPHRHPGPLEARSLTVSVSTSVAPSMPLAPGRFTTLPRST